MNREEILSHVDHTLLKPEATWPQIQTLCDEAIANHTASVCINTCYVKQAPSRGLGDVYKRQGVYGRPHPGVLCGRLPSGCHGHRQQGL